jgi:hypothetical protein
VDTTQASSYETISRIQETQSLFEFIETLSYQYLVEQDAVRFHWKAKNGTTDFIEVPSSVPTEEIYQLIMTTLRMTHGCHTKRQEGGSSKT